MPLVRNISTLRLMMKLLTMSWRFCVFRLKKNHLQAKQKIFWHKLFFFYFFSPNQIKQIFFFFLQEEAPSFAITFAACKRIAKAKIDAFKFLHHVIMVSDSNLMRRAILSLHNVKKKICSSAECHGPVGLYLSLSPGASTYVTLGCTFEKPKFLAREKKKKKSMLCWNRFEKKITKNLSVRGFSSHNNNKRKN